MPSSKLEATYPGRISSSKCGQRFVASVVFMEVHLRLAVLYVLVLQRDGHLFSIFLSPDALLSCTATNTSLSHLHSGTKGSLYCAKTAVAFATTSHSPSASSSSSNSRLHQTGSRLAHHPTMFPIVRHCQSRAVEQQIRLANNLAAAQRTCVCSFRQ